MSSPRRLFAALVLSLTVPWLVQCGGGRGGRPTDGGGTGGTTAGGNGGPAGNAGAAGHAGAPAGAGGAAGSAPIAGTGGGSKGGSKGESTTGGAAGTAQGGSGAGSGGDRSGGGGGGGGPGGGLGGRGGSGRGGGSGGASSASAYDQAVLADGPVGFWAMNRAPETEPDLSGRASVGTYRGTPLLVSMPNGDQAADFNGSSQYMSIPSNPAFSIPTTHTLTWEAWIRPDVLQFPNDSDGYVDWLGKCQDYGPTCEWEARLYDTTNSQNRCNRFSAYVFNPSAGLGAGADWQPTCGLIQTGQWYHVVGEYTTLTQPATCQNAAQYPGSIDIWVNAIPWNQSRHGQTGCFSQYQVVPKANDSPVNVGTMAMDAWFQGAIGKLAIYDKRLTQAQITNHYQLMTGKTPTGTCADSCSFQ